MHHAGVDSLSNKKSTQH